MPNYDYSCDSCGHEFTELVPIAERDDAQRCPKCETLGSKRKVSAVQLSYSGFKSNLARAGTNWNDVLKKVKSTSGRRNSIHTR